MNKVNFKDIQNNPFYKAQLKILNFMKQVENILTTKKISNKDLAKAMDVSPAYISKLFNSDINISLITMEKIATALNLELSQPELYETSIICNQAETFKSKKNETTFMYSNDNINLSSFTKSDENFSKSINIC